MLRVKLVFPIIGIKGSRKGFHLKPFKVSILRFKIIIIRNVVNPEKKKLTVGVLEAYPGLTVLSLAQVWARVRREALARAVLLVRTVTGRPH